MLISEPSRVSLFSLIFAYLYPNFSIKITIVKKTRGLIYNKKTGLSRMISRGVFEKELFWQVRQPDPIQEIRKRRERTGAVRERIFGGFGISIFFLFHSCS